MEEKKIALHLVGKELERCDRMQKLARIFKNREMESNWFLAEYRMTILWRKLQKAYKMNERGYGENDIDKKMDELELKYLKQDCGIKGL